MRLIKATALSKILGKDKTYITSKFIKSNPIGVKIMSGINYYNVDYAKCIATKLELILTEPLDEILRKIDEYRP